MIMAASPLLEQLWCHKHARYLLAVSRWRQLQAHSIVPGTGIEMVLDGFFSLQEAHLVLLFLPARPGPGQSDSPVVRGGHSQSRAILPCIYQMQSCLTCLLDRGWNPGQACTDMVHAVLYHTDINTCKATVMVMHREELDALGAHELTGAMLHAAK